MKGYLLRQLRLFLAQFAVLGVTCAIWLFVCAYLAPDVLAIMYGAYIWALLPIWGGFLTVRAVLKGMQPYLAPWALPIAPAAAQLLVTGTGIDMAAVVIYALIGLICAAAGDELRKRRHKRGSGK